MNNFTQAKNAKQVEHGANVARFLDYWCGGETHVEGLVRRNHAQAANPTADVRPWFEHGMTGFECELFYSVSETDF